MKTSPVEETTYRILDANLNRLREGLRIVEEYFRFVCNDRKLSLTIKTIRHRIRTIESRLDHTKLLAARDTGKDPLSKGNRPTERRRTGFRDVAAAGFKRAQEASRVIEEYSKLLPVDGVCDEAKLLRFSLYSFEKKTMLSDNP